MVGINLEDVYERGEIKKKERRRERERGGENERERLLFLNL